MALSLTFIDHPGPAEATPLILAHGLFGNGRNWGALARRWSETRRVIAVDMRNHADSPWADEMTYPAMAADLAALIDAECGGRAMVVGHSMGGKAAMVLACESPAKVAALVVGDIAPVSYDHDHSGYIAAMQGMDLSRITRRSQADAALRYAEPNPGVRAFLLQNLRLSGDETPRWRPNLAALKAGMPAILGFPEGLAPYGEPTLFLAGGASDYVRPEYEAEIKRLFPQSEIERAAGAGHWVHAERPDWFVERVERFLSR